MLPLAQATEALRKKQGLAGEEKLRFYALGDSVLRNCIASLVSTGVGAAKQECAKSSAKLPIEALQNTRQESCILSDNTTSVHFNWLQWLSPQPLHNTHDNRTNTPSALCDIQATDFCSAYAKTGEGLDQCFSSFFRGAKPTDFLVIRAGLQYVLFDSAWGNQLNNCGKLSDANQELTHALQSFPDKIKNAFPGKVIWWMLSPVAPVGQKVRCNPPLSALGPSIEALNKIIEPAARAAGFGVLSKPEKYLIGQHNTGGYTDCLHFQGSGCMATFTLLFNISLKMLMA
jgi:hypothetical protein